MTEQDNGTSASPTGLSPSVEPVPVSPPDGASIPSAVATFQYRFSLMNRDGMPRERHDWCLIGEAGAINIWAEPGSLRGWDRWLGGVECHWASPPDYYEGQAPHHENCWLIEKPCWHDGSSLYFSERIVPMLPEPTGKQMDGSENDRMLYILRDWFDDKFAPQGDAR